MTGGLVDPDRFWALPGPRGFLARLQADLDSSDWTQEIVVALPQAGAPPALVQHVASLRSPRRVVSVHLCPDDDDSVLARCLHQAGLDLPPRQVQVGDLLDGRLADHLLVIDAMPATPGQAADVLRLVEACAAVAHNAAPASMPLQVVALVPGEWCARLQEGLRLNVRWWWGQIGRLDVLLLLHEHDDRSDPTRNAAIAELALFDLEVARHLAASWDGDLASVAERVLEVCPGDRGAAPPAGERVLPERPGSALLQPWSSGACDLWDGRLLAWHPSVTARHDKDALARALWRAQAATILPLLEEQRLRVVAWLERLGHGGQLRQHYGETPEIGDVRYYMRNRAGMRTRPQMPLVDWLREARNSVAHLRCVDADELRRGLDLIETVPL